jgi:predicted transcriptional regulator
MFMADFAPVKTEKIIVSIRLGSDVLEKLDRIAGETDISRNELINQCIEFALDNFKKDQK